jgi:hypothetical protein
MNENKDMDEIRNNVQLLAELNSQGIFLPDIGK